MASQPDRRASASLNTAVAAAARSFFSHRSQVAAALEVTGALAIALVLLLRPSPRPGEVVMAAASALAVVIAGLRIAIGSRLPDWTLQVDVGLGTLVVSVVSLVSAREHVGLANLYLLVVLFAVLYLPLRAALAHVAAAGVAYAVVLGLGLRPAEPPVLAWLAVFGTAVITGAVVLGLVSFLRTIAREDPLTGLANRRLWDERLEEEMERSRRAGTALSVALADLDSFKAVNDARGHHTGDLMLQDLSRSWRAAVRGGGDFLARLGGDEFGLLAPGSDEIGIRRLARRLADSLPEGISASIGVATWTGDETGSDLLRRADRAMYEAKRRRRRATNGHSA